MTDFGERQEIPPLGGLTAEFEVIRELGRGGTAVVYLATEREVGRPVAIKVIHPALAVDEESVERLIREARTLARLNHPNIITLYGTRRLEDGRLALIMQYAGGDTLRARMRAVGAFEFAAATAILRDIASALVHAHQQRIVHRDIKPENIHLDAATGQARLSDFGIARILDHDASLTLGGVAIGTPTYMSPEQIDGTDVDGRSDIYSLALIGWELLSGQSPWAGEGIYSIIYKQKYEQLPSLSELRPGIPKQLAHALEVALRKDPAERWPDAKTFLERLEAITPEVIRQSRGATGPRRGAVSRTAAPTSPVPARSPQVKVDDDQPTIRFRWSADRPQVPAPGSKGRKLKRARAGILIALALVVGGGTLAAGGISMRSGIPLFGDGVTAESSELDGSAPGGGLQDPPPPTIPPRPVGGDSVVDTTSLPEPVVAEPARLVVLAGERLQGLPLTTLTDTILIRVEDAEGRPIAGVPVHLRVLEGPATIRGHSTETDDTGVIRATWTLGAATGISRAIAVVNDVPGAAVQLEAVSWRPELTPLPEVVAGGAHTCTLTSTGRLSCWGANDRGQTGVGGRSVLTPTLISLGSTVATVAAGVFHTCALTSEGDARCWGANERGQLGTGLLTPQEGITPVAGEVGFIRITAGLAHTCGLSHHGAVYCWGANENGQLGDGTRGDRPIPAAARGTRGIRAVTAGWAHTCALARDGRAYCWGANQNGQLGDGTTTDKTEPVAIAGGLRLGALAAGSAHTCGIGTDGVTYCWGRNDGGQLGTGDFLERSLPTPVELNSNLVQVSAGGVHTCGLTAEGLAYCWGRNHYGQLGDGTTTDRSTPTLVTGSMSFTSIHATGAHTCASTRTGTAYCWGYNADGQLGDGSRNDQLRPVLVQPTGR